MKKILFAIILALIICLPVCAMASEASVTADKTSVSVGDQVTVTIVVTGENLSAVQGAFTYDPSVLTYVSASGGISDGLISMVSAREGGASSLTGTVKFVAAGSGESVIDVTIDQAFNYSGAPLESSAAAVSITCESSSGSQGTTPADPSAAAVDISSTGVPARNIEGTANQMYIWRSLSSLTLPGGYADRQIEYHGEFVGGAAVPDTEYPILLYLSEANGENAGYYIYDKDQDILFPYQTLSSVRAVYTLMRPDAVTPVPEGFAETTLVLGERTYPSWTSEDRPGLYLVYAKTTSGEKNFYLYDPEDESMQRYAASAVIPDDEPAEPVLQQEDEPVKTDEKTDSISLSWFYVVCGVCILLAAALVYLIIVNNSLKDRSSRRSDRY